ncbi:MAG: tryptophan--tRNA ligase [Rhodospirillaceae bacterium]|jgi:tryptophanyl-tRNA synthetase|nr:tryptophan--tRNA ligase [Rhodospirillaceae bacterium]MBT5193172.1 tryptophan--tRNA ligase [Rhodospirillaceae bacterium]MBT5895873.1 tryptophan--tRNA ligase [Rhodospirillaceae bacterium]MBT6430419.1 tryptophan--tRNA ligase [Rhodospirillaceae bacterium]MBT7758596.1 tryptophan--tRNA ligase [Rhodospirillaceae bacterium]
MKRIFSGVQPTGNLHLGNYLGAIRNFARLQDDYECIYCVVDMHAITMWQDPAELQANTREVTATYLAAGIDAKRHIIFNQSQVPAHAELAWVFNCVTRLGWLNRMTQFKDKAGKHRENASAGLYVYPALMAADILLYKATHVPVGEDQKQHLELTRDVAQKFNNDFGKDIFPIVEPLIYGEATRVMSLRDGAKKMSKSDPSDYSRITFTDGPDEIAQKIRKAKTDPQPLPDSTDGFEGRPEAANLITIYAALADITADDVLADYGGQQFSDFKKALTDLAVEKLGPVGQEMQRLMADPAYVDSILKDGAERAEAIARPILKEVYEAVGFLNVR